MRLRRLGQVLACALLLAACGSEAGDPAPAQVDAAPSSSASSLPSAAAPAASEQVPEAASTTVGGLTLASRKLVCERLTSELTIELHASPGVATDPFMTAVKKLLDGYQSAELAGSRSKLRYRVIEVKTPELAAAAQKEGLTEGPMSSDPSGAVDLRSRYFGFVLRLGSEKVVIPFWPPSDAPLGLEFFLTAKMREIQARAQQQSTRIGVLSRAPGPTLKEASIASRNPMNVAQVMSEYFPYYVFEELMLGGGEVEIDADLSGVIVMQPPLAYSEPELRRLDEFLMRGNKSLVFFVGAASLAPSEASMDATLGLRGLDKLLGGYGIELRDELVLDRDSAYSAGIINPAGERVKLQHPGIPVLSGDRLDRSFAPFRGIASLPFPFASPLVAHPERQPQARVTVVARTRATATVDASRKQSMKFTAAFPSGVAAAERALAIAVDGTIRSAFAEAPTSSPAPSRVLVIASSQFLANPFARAGNPPPLPPQLQMMGGPRGDDTLHAFAQPYTSSHFASVVVSFKNTLDWMTFDDDFAELGAQLIQQQQAAKSAP